MLNNFSIAPHFIKRIKFTGFREHYMHHNTYIIDQNPLQSLVSFVFVSVFVAVFFYFFLYKFANGPHLLGVACLAYHKKVRYGLIYFSKVKRNNFFTLLFLNCVYDCFENP